MNAFHLLESKCKIIFDIAGRICIVRKLGMIVKLKFFCRNPQCKMPLHPFFLPVLIPLLLCAGTDKELHFHLLELTHAENELPCDDLIPECFTDLRYSERK